MIGSSLRWLAERLSRGVVVRRTLPRVHGGQTIYASPDASLRFWRRDLAAADPLLLSLSSELVKKGHKVWDIGANIGLFALSAAFHAGRSGSVVAVEPDPWLASLLSRSGAGLSPGCARFEVVRAAMSDRRGEARFSIARRARAASHLSDLEGSMQTGGVRETIAVETLTLDDLLDRFGVPDLVKIDTERAEVLCLQGGPRVLATGRPTLVIEVGSENSAAVGHLLHEAGYLLFDAEVPAGCRQPVESPPWNTIAIPRERISSAAASGAPIGEHPPSPALRDRSREVSGFEPAAGMDRVRLRFPIEPRYRGVAGHWNKNYDSPAQLAKWLLRSAVRTAFPRLYV